MNFLVKFFSVHNVTISAYSALLQVITALIHDIDSITLKRNPFSYRILLLFLLRMAIS